MLILALFALVSPALSQVALPNVRAGVFRPIPRTRVLAPIHVEKPASWRTKAAEHQSEMRPGDLLEKKPQYLAAEIFDVVSENFLMAHFDLMELYYGKVEWADEARRLRNEISVAHRSIVSRVVQYIEKHPNSDPDEIGDFIEDQVEWQTIHIARLLSMEIDDVKIEDVKRKVNSAVWSSVHDAHSSGQIVVPDYKQEEKALAFHILTFLPFAVSGSQVMYEMLKHPEFTISGFLVFLASLKADSKFGDFIIATLMLLLLSQFWVHLGIHANHVLQALALGHWPLKK